MRLLLKLLHKIFGKLIKKKVIFKIKVNCVIDVLNRFVNSYYDRQTIKYLMRLRVKSYC